jgi:hypothetical protein
MMSNDDSIIENMHLSHIHLAVRAYLTKNIGFLKKVSRLKKKISRDDTVVKLRLSEKATKFEEISILVLTL